MSPGSRVRAPQGANLSFLFFIDYNSNAYFLRLYYKLNTMARNQKSRRSSSGSGSRKSRKYGKNTYKGGKSNASKRGTRRSGRVMQHGG